MRKPKAAGIESRHAHHPISDIQSEPGAISHEGPESRGRWVTRYSAEGERRFFFYATLVMALVYFAPRLLAP